MLTVERLFVCILIAAGSYAPHIAAQSYPSKPIRVLSGVPVGTGHDTTIRMVAPTVGAALGQPFLIESRPAATGTAAALAVKNSPPDGYNLLFVTSGTIVNAFFLMKSVAFDPIKDFTPIAEVMNNPSLLVVSAALPVNSVKEFIQYARSNPGKIAYGSTGVGSAFHLLGESFSLDVGVSMLHVPYTGAMAIPVGDLANNRIQLFWPSLTSISPVLNSGKVKVLAIVDSVPLKSLPGVPTILKDVPNYNLNKGWSGLFGPAGLPQSVALRLQKELHKALHAQDVEAKLDALGMVPVGSPPEEFETLFHASLEKTRAIVNRLKLEPQ